MNFHILSSVRAVIIKVPDLGRTGKRVLVNVRG